MTLHTRDTGAPARRSYLVLLVDDNAAALAALQLLLAMHEIPSVSASTPDEALRRLDDGDVIAVVQDMTFTDDPRSAGDQAQLFRQIRRKRPDVPVIVLMEGACLEAAVALVREGAADCIAKPLDDDKLVARLRALLPPATAARLSVPAGADLCGLVYASAAMHDAVLLALRVAPSDAPVLITGENGCGKDRLAAVIHAHSRRVGKPFVRVDMGALPETLLEAELFGAEPGAYTGASRRRLGCFEIAVGGTLFLDEIGNLAPSGQAKLLRVLQTGEFQRLGSSETHLARARVLAATNVNLPEAIGKGMFREDLYYRLAVIEARIPPLRDRREDIPVLAAHFLDEYAAEPREFSEDARRALASHDWPGNVRELANRIRRAVLVSSSALITPRDLGLQSPTEAAPAGAVERDGKPSAVALGDRMNASSDDKERTRIEAVFAATGGVVAQAAARLGISRQALYRRMKRLGLFIERRLKDDSK